jgi:transporter family-2 protein
VLSSILAGIFTSVETSINSQLGKYLTPSIATLHSLATGMVFMLLIGLIRGSLGRYLKVATVNPLWLMGGFFGAFIIYLSSKAIPVLGVSRALTLVLAGQIISGLFIDAFFYRMDVGWEKIGGVLLFLLGVHLIIK